MVFSFQSLSLGLIAHGIKLTPKGEKFIVSKGGTEAVFDPAPFLDLQFRYGISHDQLIPRAVDAVIKAIKAPKPAPPPPVAPKPAAPKPK
jgi:hypothetical protein